MKIMKRINFKIIRKTKTFLIMNKVKKTSKSLKKQVREDFEYYCSHAFFGKEKKILKKQIIIII